MSIKRTSITLEPEIYELGLENAKRRGFGHSFSAYVAWLIQRDAEGSVVREDVSSQPNDVRMHEDVRYSPKKPEPKRARGK